MMVLEQISTSNVAAYKTGRLRALEDSPAAFGSTFARESQLTDTEWLIRTANMNGEKGIGYLAMNNKSACGIIGAFRDEDDSLSANIVSMWVAPTHRRTGVGSSLIFAIQVWARGCGVRKLRLMVTSSNRSAIKFYEQMKFSMTGRTESYPNDPLLIEYEMSQVVPNGGQLTL
jgi:ribosomal protein S18 acetylase RimI-like enzyme